MKCFCLFVRQLLLFFILLIVVACTNEDSVIRKEKTEIKSSSEDHFYLVKKGDRFLVVKSFDQKNEYFLWNDILLPQGAVTRVRKFESAQEAEEYIDNYSIGDHMNKNSNSSNSRNTLRAPIEPDTNLWNNGFIYLAIEPSSNFSLQQKSDIYKAISQWAQRTKLKFKITTTASPASKIIINSVEAGCSSTTGDPFPSNGSMSLSKTCDLQSVIHELGHGIGLIHEHQRPKRNAMFTDLYTTADYNFIRNNVSEVGLDGNSVVTSIKNNLEVIEVIDDSAPFDYRSVMLYGSYPRNNLKLAEFLRKYNLPFYRDLNGEEIPRPIKGVTDLDADKIRMAYPDLPN